MFIDSRESPRHWPPYSVRQLAIDLHLDLIPALLDASPLMSDFDSNMTELVDSKHLFLLAIAFLGLPTKKCRRKYVKIDAQGQKI